jgi:hypothetical protein
MRILNEHDHRAGFGQPPQQREHLLEQPGPGFARITALVRLAQLGHQPGQLRYSPARYHRRHRVHAQLTHQAAEDRGERGERQLIPAQLQTAADQHPRLRNRGGELGHQPRLSRSGLAADQQRRMPALAGPRERISQGGHLLGPADQNRTGPLTRHEPSMPVGRSRPVGQEARA